MPWYPLQIGSCPQPPKVPETMDKKEYTLSIMFSPVSTPEQEDF